MQLIARVFILIGCFSSASSLVFTLYSKSINTLSFLTLCYFFLSPFIFSCIFPSIPSFYTPISISPPIPDSCHPSFLSFLSFTCVTTLFDLFWRFAASRGPHLSLGFPAVVSKTPTSLSKFFAQSSVFSVSLIFAHISLLLLFYI